MEIELFQDGGQIKTKRTSITTMGAKIQAFDIFQTLFSSHYPLPLSGFLNFWLKNCLTSFLEDEIFFLLK